MAALQEEPQANLRMATTADLIAELTTRIEQDGRLDYRPWDEGTKDEAKGTTIGAPQVGKKTDEGATTPPPARTLPEGKRVARTKSTGDRVYMLDEAKKTRQWVTNPDVLAKLGFVMGDVVDIEDPELLRYQMGPALYRVADETA